MRIIVGIGLVCALGCSAREPATVSPGDTVRKFYEAFNQRILGVAAMLVKGGKPKADYSKHPLIGDNSGSFPHIEVKKTTETITGATARVEAKLEAGLQGDMMPVDDTVALERMGGAWKIVPKEPDFRAQNMTQAFAYIVIHPEILLKARAAAQKMSCLSNLKQIAVSALLFLGDHDDTYSFTQANAKTKLARYLKNNALWHCPLGGTYSFNGALSGKKMNAMHDPSMTVMFYEGRGGKLDFRHEGMATVAFVDGHVKVCNAGMAKSLRWKP